MTSSKSGLYHFRNIMKMVFSFVVLIIISWSCTTEQTKKSMLYSSGGKTKEVLIVASNMHWNSIIGDTVRAVLQEWKPWLIQAEPDFDLIQIQHEAFSEVYQKFRNVFIIKIDESLSENVLKMRKDVFSTPQTIIEFRCKSTEDFIKLFTENQIQIASIFQRNEINRINAAYEGIRVDSISKRLYSKFGFSLTFPQGFFIASNRADFAWIRKDIPDIEEGFLIYTRPYADTADFSLNTIISDRDSITKKFIPGPVAGSYMKASSVFPHQIETTTFKGNYASLVRSWWDLQGYPMGGPFLSYTFVDTVASRLITIDGYVKAPKKDKRDLLLQIEAIMNTYTTDTTRVK